MSAADDMREMHAIDWAIRVDAPAFDDWEALTAWLEADVANAAAFDRATIRAHEAAVALAGAPTQTATILPFAAAPRQRAARGAWMALAASLVAAVATLFTMLPSEKPAAAIRIAATAPGETRVLALADGTRIEMNGATRIAWRTDAREARLLAGEALFTVTHREEAPFRVHVGATTVTDVGTIFDLALAERTTRVAVSEGSVDVATARSRARLRRGDGVDVDAAGTIGARRPVAPATVGLWRARRLFYEDARLDRVLADVTRRTGVRVSLESGLAARHFAGTLDLSGDASTIVARTASVLGLTAERRGDGTWRLKR